jgi:hypothetical protein
MMQPPLERRRSRRTTARRFFIVTCPILLTTLLSWSQALAAGGGKPATKLVNVADTRLMSPGLGKWLAGIYNDSYWLYALVSVGIMAGMGIVLGLGMDRLISLLGINLGKMDHHE